MFMSSLVIFSVPLYKLFCDLTGFQGFNQQTSNIDSNSEYLESQLDINVIFTSQVEEGLDWIFEAPPNMSINEGKKYDVISGFISKFPNHTQRIAALLFLYENQNERVIGPEYVENAIEISRYFIDQAFELFGPEASDEVLAHKLCEYLECCADQSTERTKILQFGPPELRNKKNRDRATNYAMDKGYIYSPDDKHICLTKRD